MTNIEILKFLIGCNAEYTESQLEAYLILNDLVPGDAYLLQNKCVIYGIAIQAIESQPQSGIKQIQEGGYTITYRGSWNSQCSRISDPIQHQKSRRQKPS